MSQDAAAWTCPICGMSLTLTDEDGPFCIRHGTQDDIDDEPDYEQWHSEKGKRHE